MHVLCRAIFLLCFTETLPSISIKNISFIHFIKKIGERERERTQANMLSFKYWKYEKNWLKNHIIQNYFPFKNLKNTFFWKQVKSQGFLFH